MKKHVGKVIVGFTAATTVATLGLTTAFASTTSFDSQYQSNLNTEQSLLTQAQSSSSNSTVSALLSTVQNINTQVNALYTAEHALASAKSSIPAPTQDETALKRLMSHRQDLLKQSNAEWKLVGEYEHHKGKTGLLKKALAQHDQLQKEVTSINNQISSLEKKIHNNDGTKSDPYDGGLEELQDSILKLQASAIHYTKEAIALEQSTTTSSTSSSDTGSTNTGTDTGSTSNSTSSSDTGSTSTSTDTASTSSAS
jgi:hypothetical protein